jgi:hypothetical protein
MLIVISGRFSVYSEICEDEGPIEFLRFTVVDLLQNITALS